MADVPFSCISDGYQIAGIPSDFARICFTAGQDTILSTLNITINAIGYNVLDNFIYGINYNTGDLIRIDSTPTLKNYGAIPNLPMGAYNAGTIDLQGHLFIYISGFVNYYVVDVNNLSSTFGYLLDPTNNYILDTLPFGTPLSTPLNISDWAYNSIDSQLYGLDNITGNMVRINPNTGVVTTLTTIGVPTGIYGINFIDVEGNIYEIDNNLGLVYKITISEDMAKGEIFSTSLATIQSNNTNYNLAKVSIDFGDTPDISLTTNHDDDTSLLASNSPNYQALNQLFLGNGIVDDSQNHLPILSSTVTTYSFTEPVTNNTGVNANLYAWIDFNKDGIFQENECFTTIVYSTDSTQNIPIIFNVPFGITPGYTCVRICLTTDTLINQNTLPICEDTRSITSTSDGEIRNYRLQIAVTTPTCPPPISQTINANTSKTGKVVSIDPFNLPITYSMGNIPINGTAKINPATGDWKYIPNNNFVGIDTFSFVVTNKNGESCTTNATITVVAFHPNYSFSQNEIISSIETATGIINHIKLQNKPVKYNVDTLPSNGVAIVNSTTGIWTYKPNMGFIGNDMFTIKVISSNELVYITTISIKVTPIPPTSSLTQVQEILINGVANGSIVAIDGEGQKLAYNVTIIPINGIAVMNSATSTWTYKPNLNFIGTDSFTITATNQSGLSCTTQIIINIHQASIQMDKIINNHNILLGDIFIYTINIKNIGTIPIQSSIITDKLSDQLQVDQLQLNENIISGNIKSGVDIGTLAIGETKSITVTAKILSMPSSNPFKSTATGFFQSFMNSNLPSITITQQAEENIGVNIYNPKLTLIKSANKTVTAIGEIVTYNIIARNDGNIELSEILISDLLSPELKFIDDSVKVNDVSQLTSSIISEINIGLLDVGQFKTLTFDVEVIVQGTGTINNISTAIFQFKPNKTESPVSGTSTSNSYFLTVKNPSLLLTETSNKEIALLDDIITYTAVITNNGDIDTINVIFKTILSNIVQFVDGTFVVNGRLINSVNLSTGINIGNISIGTTVTITYQVKVIYPSSQNSVTNSTLATFGYFTGMGIINYAHSNESNIEVTLALSIFKQTNIQNYFEIPSLKPDIKQINVVTANTEIENCYAIETPVGTSIEGQQLTGYKMVIHGNIIFVIDYTADTPQQNVHSAHYCLPFSSFVILPSNFSFSCQTSINTIIEDVYSNQISNRCFYANATALITIGIR